MRHILEGEITRLRHIQKGLDADVKRFELNADIAQSRIEELEDVNRGLEQKWSNEEVLHRVRSVLEHNNGCCLDNEEERLTVAEQVTLALREN